MSSDQINWLDKKDLDKLISQTSSARNKLILQILYETGCSTSELVKIKVKDVKDKNIQIKGKTPHKALISNKLYYIYRISGIINDRLHNMVIFMINEI